MAVARLVAALAKAVVDLMPAPPAVRLEQSSPWHAMRANQPGVPVVAARAQTSDTTPSAQLWRMHERLEQALAGLSLH